MTKELLQSFQLAEAFLRPIAAAMRVLMERNEREQSPGTGPGKLHQVQQTPPGKRRSAIPRSYAEVSPIAGVHSSEMLSQQE